MPSKTTDEGMAQGGATAWPGITTALEKMVVPQGSARCSLRAPRGPLPVTCAGKRARGGVGVQGG